MPPTPPTAQSKNDMNTYLGVLLKMNGRGIFLLILLFLCNIAVILLKPQGECGLSTLERRITQGTMYIAIAMHR